MTRLLIADGILLKEYTLPHDGKTGLHVDPPEAWMPDYTCDWAVAKARELCKKNESWQDYICRNVAAVEYQRDMAKKRLPCPGWIPVSPTRDRDIVRAYRNLFVELTSEVDKSAYPPDGHYVLRSGTMEVVNDT